MLLILMCSLHVPVIWEAHTLKLSAGMTLRALQVWLDTPYEDDMLLRDLELVSYPMSMASFSYRGTIIHADVGFVEANNYIP